MIQSPEDPPDRPDDDGDLRHEEIDTSAPDRRQLSGAPTTEEDPQVQSALDAARHHAELLRAGGVDLVGVYVIGSAAVGDRWPHSDIDTVAVTAEPIGDPAVLTDVHDAMARQLGSTCYDTVYLPRAWLAAPPAEHSPTPYSLDGRLVTTGNAPLVHPVTWLELATSLVADGEPVDRLGVLVELGKVAAYTRANLSGYWGKVAEQLTKAASSKPADAPLTNAYPVVWTVLGAPRLGAMLDRVRRSRPGETPRLVSKTEAGEWVMHHLPHYADLAGRALQHRHGRDASFTVADAAAAARLVSEVIVVANSRRS